MRETWEGEREGEMGAGVGWGGRCERETGERGQRERG